MTDIKRLLQDADPMREEEGLAPDDAQRMRRTMLAARDEDESHVAFFLWRRPWALALAVVVVLIGLGGVAGDGRFGFERNRSEDLRAAAPFIGSGSSEAGDRRQLQFATPGGTRIIWIFDENLRLQESMK
jgi:hypothetical protein